MCEVPNTKYLLSGCFKQVVSFILPCINVLSENFQCKANVFFWEKLTFDFKENKKRRNATKTRFSTIQPSIDMTGIRNERWQWRKNDALFLVALVACTKFNFNFILPKVNTDYIRQAQVLNIDNLRLITYLWKFNENIK